MRNIDVTVDFPADGKAPVGYQKIDCHMIFDVKMTLEQKARYVAGGHQTEPPKVECGYSGQYSDCFPCGCAQ